MLSELADIDSYSSDLRKLPPAPEHAHIQLPNRSVAKLQKMVLLNISQREDMGACNYQ